MIDVVRNSRISLSWMLVQGVLFAGLTILITARTRLTKLLPHTGLQFFLIDLPAWVRKCAICLAVMNERWNDELLSTLESRFDSLVDDTLRFVSTNITTSLAASDTSVEPNKSGPVHEVADICQDQNVLQNQIWPIDDGFWNESAYMDFAMSSDFNQIQLDAWELF